MSHTPGPWEIEHHKSEPPAVTDDPGYWTIDGEVLAGKFGPVADTLNRNHCIDPDEDRANAKLIAAAPELLDVVRRCELWLGTHAEGQAMQEVCRQVMLKATS